MTAPLQKPSTSSSPATGSSPQAAAKGSAAKGPSGPSEKRRSVTATAPSPTGSHRTGSGASGGNAAGKTAGAPPPAPLFGLANPAYGQQSISITQTPTLPASTWVGNGLGNAGHGLLNSLGQVGEGIQKGWHALTGGGIHGYVDPGRDIHGRLNGSTAAPGRTGATDPIVLSDGTIGFPWEENTKGGTAGGGGPVNLGLGRSGGSNVKGGSSGPFRPTGTGGTGSTGAPVAGKSEWDPLDPFSPKQGAPNAIQGIIGHSKTGDYAITRYTARPYLELYRKSIHELFPEATPVTNAGQSLPRISGEQLENMLNDLARSSISTYHPKEAPLVRLNPNGPVDVPAGSVVSLPPQYDPDNRDKLAAGHTVIEGNLVQPGDTIYAVTSNNLSRLMTKKALQSLVQYGSFHGPEFSFAKYVIQDIRGNTKEYRLFPLDEYIEGLLGS
jgi:hypothetical protein